MCHFMEIVSVENWIIKDNTHNNLTIDWLLKELNKLSKV